MEIDVVALGITWVSGIALLMFLAYTMKNGNKRKVARFLFRNHQAERLRKRYSAEYLKDLRQRTLKPRWGRAALPLALMLIVVLLLLNNYAYFAVVTSESMSPTLNKGDLVLMTKQVDLREGDIVIFDAPNQPTPILHRVTKIEGEQVITKGDFAPSEDQWDTTAEDVYGETIMMGGKPVVLKGVGSYFIEDYRGVPAYGESVDVTRMFLNGMKGLAVVIFFSAVVLYIGLTVVEVRKRKA